MEGFALRDSVEFDDWLRDLQDDIRRERAGLLDRLTDALATRDGPTMAVARARERLALDDAARTDPPAADRALRRRRPSRRCALQYRECVRVLDRELGVAPLAETTELYNAVSAGTLPEAQEVIEQAHPPAS